jgi:hypothetical protein
MLSQTFPVRQGDRHELAATYDDATFAVLREELAAPPEEGSLEVESPAEGEPNDSENEPENEGKDDDFRVSQGWRSGCLAC